MREQSNFNVFISICLIIIIILILFFFFSPFRTQVRAFNSTEFIIAISHEKKEIGEKLEREMSKKKIQISIVYKTDDEIISSINNGRRFDAIFLNDTSYLNKIKNLSTIDERNPITANPIGIAIKNSFLRKYGLEDKVINNRNIINAVSEKKLKFIMPDPIETKVGSQIYQGLISSLSSNPKQISINDIENTSKEINKGISRTTKTNSDLKESMLKHEAEVYFVDEATLVNVNLELETFGKELYYFYYPNDGLVYNGSILVSFAENDTQRDIYNIIKEFLLSDEIQSTFTALGERGLTLATARAVDANIFREDFGISFDGWLIFCICFGKMEAEMIEEVFNEPEPVIPPPISQPVVPPTPPALPVEESPVEKKPNHTIFILDYSSSMSGRGKTELVNAMEYLLDKNISGQDNLAFRAQDRITVIPFNSKIIDIWSTDNGENTSHLITSIRNQRTTGGTNFYIPLLRAVEILNDGNDSYQKVIILVTDGKSSRTNQNQLLNTYQNNNLNIPIFSIAVGSADYSQLHELANLSNGQVFDGTTSLLEAFKAIRKMY